VADKKPRQKPKPETQEALEPDQQAEELDEAELEARLAEELRKLKIQDILLQTAFTLASLGFRRLEEDDRDVEQGRLAIEALRALLPVLREAVPPSVTRDLNQTIANLQFAYAKAVTTPPKKDGEAAT
jgi:hypothetical protein